MYTYIIAAVISLIAIGCIFKSTKRLGISVVLIFTATLFSSVTVNCIRKNNLPLIDEVFYIKTAIPQVINYDTTYIKSDTSKELDGTLFIYQEIIFKGDTIPKNGKNIIKRITPVSHGLQFKDSIIQMKYWSSEDETAIFKCLPGDTLYESAATHFEMHIIHRVGDNWSTTWSFPTEKSYIKLKVCKEDLEYLKLSNPKLFSKWTVVNL